MQPRLIQSDEVREFLASLRKLACKKCWLLCRYVDRMQSLKDKVVARFDESIPMLDTISLIGSSFSFEGVSEYRVAS